MPKMDNEILVKELQNTLAILRETKGRIALFMLNASEIDISSANNLIVSASCYDDMPAKKAITELAFFLKHELSQSSLKQIIRITVLRTHDPFVIALNRAYHVEDSIVYLPPCDISGIYIEKAIIFESVPVSPDRTKQKTTKEYEEKVA